MHFTIFVMRVFRELLKKPFCFCDGFKAARCKNLDACKLNIGGSGRFLSTQLNATRKAILYSDTVLIPDPDMPWLEKNRDEEAFQHVHILQAMFLICLKSLYL